MVRQILMVMAVAGVLAGQDRMTVREIGRGAPVLLLPSLGCPGDVWNPVAERLAEKYHSFLISIPGFAGAAGRQSDFGMVIDAVAEFVKKRDLKDVTLAGHSFGGHLALSLAVNIGPLFEGDHLRRLSIPGGAGEVRYLSHGGAVAGL